MPTQTRELKCYWMRGLPACGKTAKALSLVENTEGIICDPHQWFQEREEEFRHYKLTRAKRWAWYRCKVSAQQRVTPIVVDMHVGINNMSIQRFKDLKQYGYQIELVEPNSDDWITIRNLLYNRQLNREALNQWAQILADRSQYHKYTEIRAQMNNWHFATLDEWAFN